MEVKKKLARAESQIKLSWKAKDTISKIQMI